MPAGRRASGGCQPRAGAPLNRSQQMARIRGRHTAPERALRQGLWRAGLRYRLHARTSAGRPDLLFRSRKVAVFIDGCFFHGCPEHYVRPRSNADFWARKLATNVIRDRRQTLELEQQGWTVLRFWEHEVYDSPDVLVARVQAAVCGAVSRAASQLRVVRVDVVEGGGDLERRFFEDLRDPTNSGVVERQRSTRKWSRKSMAGVLGGPGR